MEHADISLADDGGPFRPKALPIAQTILIAAGLYFLASMTLEVVEHFTGLPERPLMGWIHESYIHLVQLGFALGVITLLRRSYPGTYGLQWPEGESYVVPAILWGLGFGVLMTVIGFAPQILTQKPPTDQPYPLTAFNITGWLLYRALLAGPAAEVVFRGLLVTYLTQRMPGKIAYRGYEMNGAGVVVAGLFALSFSESFINKPFVVALGQFLVALAMGVFFAYWFEKSKSLLAPVIGNSVSGVVGQGIVLMMVAAWSGHPA
jgi:membrane protease YdiL (CAAX protease family)